LKISNVWIAFCKSTLAEANKGQKAMLKEDLESKNRLKLILASLLLIVSLIAIAVWQSHMNYTYSLWSYIETYSDDPSKTSEIEKRIGRLIALSDPELIPYLYEAVKKLDTYDEPLSRVPVNAARILANYNDPKAIQVLLSLMNPPPRDGPIPPYSYLAAESISLRGDSAVPVFESFMNEHRSSYIAINSGLHGLSLIKSEKVTPVLLKYTDASYHSFIRRNAIQALLANGDPKAIEPLTKIASFDNDPSVQAVAREVVETLQSYASP
jgi:HEAT repeat protein